MADCLLVTFCSLLLLLVTSKYYLFSNIQEMSCGMYVERIFQMLIKNFTFCVSQPQYTANRQITRSYWPNSTNLCPRFANGVFSASFYPSVCFSPNSWCPHDPTSISSWIQFMMGVLDLWKQHTPVLNNLLPLITFIHIVLKTMCHPWPRLQTENLSYVCQEKSTCMLPCLLLADEIDHIIMFKSPIKMKDY